MGAEARKWAEKIRNPKTVIQKLGIKPGQKVSIVGKTEQAFGDDLARVGADVSYRLRKASDVIFCGSSLF